MFSDASVARGVGWLRRTMVVQMKTDKVFRRSGTPVTSI